MTMTIEETIEQFEDLKRDRESFAKTDEPNRVFAKDIKAIDIALKTLQENKEQKRLLKLAVEDIGKHSFCSMCENLNDNSKCRKCKAITLNNFKWKHADEAMKLIGE